MRNALIVLCLVTTVLTGCYHITVETGAPPAPTRVHRPWQHSFISGLVPPSEINTENECPQGVSRVETQRSLLNALPAILQGLLVPFVPVSIYTPITVTVTCADGPVR